MQINLFRFNKRVNSTAIMSGSGYPFEVVLKENTSMENPEFILNMFNNNPSIYNYCYCQTFSRYYFIRDWVFDGRMWIAVCECDVMGSFRTPILNSRLYVLRSASEYDDTIIDTKYPAKTGLQCDVNSIVTNFATNYNDGRYVVGVVGWSSVYASGGINYYTLDYEEWGRLRNFIFSNTPEHDGNTQLWGDLSVIKYAEGTIMNNLNMFDYISSVMWLPFTPDASGTKSHIHIAYWNSGIEANNTLNTTFRREYTIAIPKHPLANSRGQWLNCSPYSMYTLFTNYFGAISIEPQMLKDSAELHCSFSCDVLTGAAGLELWVSRTPNDPISIGHYTGQAGISQKFAGAKSENWWTSAVETGLNLADGVTDTFFNPRTAGDSRHLVKGVYSAIQSATKAFTPRPTISGVQGEGNLFTTTWWLELDYFMPTEEDITHFGRPLCKRKLISDLSGFCQVADGDDVDCFATPEEKARIAQYLEGGFYIV